MFRINRKILIGILLSVFFVIFVSAASASRGNTLSAADARAKIHPNLLAEVDAALADQNNSFAPFAITAQRGFQASQLQFVARVKAGTSLDAYTGDWFARPYTDPLGNTVAAGYASPSSILKMAANPDVISLKRSESLVAPPAPSDPDVESALARDIDPDIKLQPDAASPGPAPEGWYHTGSAIHGSQDAWAKGYTGVGVRYMSNDSGADYCHPDLHGTWAYIDDAASPYYGLPEMFDSYSSYQAAFDYYVGTTFVANGVADYSDTSATAAGNFNYTPIGAAVAHDYIVPGTSLSGEYHYGSHPDNSLASVADILSGFFGDGTGVADEHAAVLVSDENTAGVYDTVYVDLNYNFDFSDDTPARLTRDFTNQETACLDYDADGLNDVSGGLVYFIADGVTAVPTLDWFWGIPGDNFGNGDLVAFHVMDYVGSPGGDHGMGTTSVAVGQGVVSGSLGWDVAGPPQAEGKGLVVGPGKDVASTQNGDFYATPFVEDAYYYGALGYDGVSGTGDDIQIISNSWGYSGTDNDGFDNDSQLIDSINRALGPNMALLFSTGNGAAGYGTSSPPSPATGISIGASTLFDTYGFFESIASADQIVGGDVMTWSNRGPGARNVTGVDVVATGAFGTGSVALNQVLWGAVATDSFSGTSMAAPVAAGNLALIYQAWFDNFGVWPTYDEAKTVLMNSATDTHHDAWSQGAGLVNADTGTDIAGGHHGYMVSPSEWSVGDYRGTEYDAFAHIISPGETDVQTFTLTNTGSDYVRIDLDALTLTLMRRHDLSFTSLDQSMDHGLFTTPDYAMRIDNRISKDADLVQVRLTKPYDQFDPDENLLEPFNNWRVHLQNWTDLDGDNKFWEDTNGNGKVDDGEMDENEYIRFSYGYNTGPTQQVRISDPWDRIADGLLLTLRHRDQIPSVPTTDLGIELTTWKLRPWNWAKLSDKVVHLRPGQTKTVQVSLKVPKNTPYGMYEGVINLHETRTEDAVIIPVTVAVAASGTSFDFGTANKYSNRDHNLLYQNDAVYGYTDYGWRAESGDWRFFWTDIAASDLSASGTDYLVVDNAWEGEGTDIDTIILGPTATGLSPSIYGPYTLEQVGRSNNTYIGSGRWIYDTSTGGPREIVAAPAQEGLHAIMFHQVRVDGNEFDDHFGGSVGLVNVDPGVISETVAAGTGSTSLTISSEIEMGAFVANGYGLGAPVTTSETVSQDDPNDPGTASFTTVVNISNGALLDVTTGNTANGSDIDLYVYDPGGALVASSTTASDAEHVSILFPEDGDYTIAVHGWSVPVSPETFDLTINAVQGSDVTVSNLPASIPAGSSATMDVNWDTTGFAPGTYYGLILMGPAEAPGLLSVPVEITIP